nr:uncharacterized protein LOC109184147 [Ipomoea trifida]
MEKFPRDGHCRTSNTPWGNFVKDLELQYINGEVWEVDIDPDLLSYPHLVKFIKEGQYGKIETLYYKALHEPLNKLRVLWNDASVLDLTELAIKYRSCDIYVDHGIDEADLIPCYLLPGCGEPTEGNVNQEPNEGIVGEEPNEGRQSVGDEVNEESDEVNEDATEVSSDDNAEVNEESDDEGIEGDDDNYDSDGDDTELSEFENDFGGVTQEDNTGQGLEGEDLETETDKGKSSEIKAKVKTTKSNASERNEEEGEACSDDYYYESEDPPSHESEIEEVGHQKKVCPAKNSAASTSMPSAASTVDTSASMPSAASARRNKPRKRAGGFGVYINQNTGAQILNPGGRGQQILSVGRNASARAKKKQ